jgi:hypothetical protein
MTKSELVSNPTSALNKAKPKEPVFLLRGSDWLSAFVVDYWCYLAELEGVPKGKIQSAKAVARAMKRWPGRKTPT